MLVHHPALLALRAHSVVQAHSIVSVVRLVNIGVCLHTHVSHALWAPSLLCRAIQHAHNALQEHTNLDLHQLEEDQLDLLHALAAHLVLILTNLLLLLALIARSDMINPILVLPLAVLALLVATLAQLVLAYALSARPRTLMHLPLVQQHASHAHQEQFQLSLHILRADVAPASIPINKEDAHLALSVLTLVHNQLPLLLHVSRVQPAHTVRPQALTNALFVPPVHTLQNPNQLLASSALPMLLVHPTVLNVCVKLVGSVMATNPANNADLVLTHQFPTN